MLFKIAKETGLGANEVMIEEVSFKRSGAWLYGRKWMTEFNSGNEPANPRAVFLLTL